MRPLNLPAKFSNNSDSLGTFQTLKSRQKIEMLISFYKNGVSTIKQWGGYSIAHFSKLGFNINEFPSTKKMFNQLMLLPLNHMMKIEEVKYISDTILSFYKDYDD